MNKPSFLFVGTAKAGTTSIYHYLKQHPQISIPVKETFYFLKDLYQNNALPYPQQRAKDDLILNEADYNAIYQGIDSDKLVGEIGTGYLHHHLESIPLIRSMLGAEVKICIILRHPVDRCYSSYLHFVKDLHETMSFEDALTAEKDRTMAQWDFMWQHLALGMYSTQVKAYLDNFKHVKVFIYEEFRNEPVRIINELMDFIGASPKENWDVQKSFNPSGKAKNPMLQKFITHENPLKSALRPLFRLLFSKEKRERMRKDVKSKNLTKAEGMAPETRGLLMDQYEEDIAKLETLLGHRIEQWH